MDDQRWEKFFTARLDAWIDMPKYRRDLIKVYDYLGMTPDEFMDWRAYNVLPERAIQIWAVAEELAANDA